MMLCPNTLSQKETHKELLEQLPHKWKLKHPESVLTKQQEKSGS